MRSFKDIMEFLVFLGRFLGTSDGSINGTEDVDHGFPDVHG
jgi:hypothetical protein